MMFLSEVWFSLEGTSPWIQKISKILPLSHVTEGMRQIMNEGAGISDIRFHLISLILMTLLFMVIGSALFKWTEG